MDADMLPLKACRKSVRVVTIMAASEVERSRLVIRYERWRVTKVARRFIFAQSLDRMPNSTWRQPWALT